MLRLKEEEGMPPVVDEEEPILPTRIRARDDGPPAAERKGQPPTSALLPPQQIGPRIASDQASAFGIRENHLRFSDLLKFGEYRAQSVASAGFISALGFLDLNIEEHVQRPT